MARGAVLTEWRDEEDSRSLRLGRGGGRALGLGAEAVARALFSAPRRSRASAWSRLWAIAFWSIWSSSGENSSMARNSPFLMNTWDCNDQAA